MSTYTHQQIRDNFTAALKKIKTGVLKNTPEDIAFIERTVVQHILVNKLEPTEANFSKAFIALATVLPWAVKPAKLVAQEENDRPATVVSAQQSENQFAAKKKAGDKADADAKEHAALVEQCKSIIEGYNPTKNTRSGSAYDAREREEMQALWIKELHKAKEKSVEYMRSFTKGLAAARAKRYADRERASEHL
jgi:hypothetical protein